MVDFNFSVFSAAPAADAEDTALTDLLATAIGRSPAPERWRTGRAGMWCTVVPDGASRHSQGWKLHVAGTPGAAPEILERCLGVLLQAGSAFKFAATTDYVAALNSRNAPRGHSGKFITVYPENDQEAVRLAAALHEATDGLPGPRILSDRPYATDSLVHYRYGAFTEDRRLTNDGFYAWMIIDPEGNPVEDRRVGRYTPPPWVTCPFPDNGRTVTRTEGGSRKDIVIGGRFAVENAIRHTNKGGVYRAVDVRTGDPVVLKEARPHVAADPEGRDTRDRLRAEARALERIQDRRLAPRPAGLFTQNGHLFLAQEMIPGTPLREWTADSIRESGWGPHLAPALDMARRLADLMIEAHAAGLVLRDFNPNNVMVRPDGTPVLIDLELAVVAGEGQDAPLRAGTPAFSAPEQFEGAPPHATADYYSLGATLCYVLTGGPPYFLDEHPRPRPLTQRLTEWLAARTQGLDLPEPLRAVLVELMADDPARRGTPARARSVLTSCAPCPVPPQAQRAGRHISGGDTDPGEAAPAWLRETCEQVIRGITGQLLSGMEPESAQALWPMSCVHGAPDPCSLQHGAAGCTGALVRYMRYTDDPRLPDAAATAARWMLDRLRDGTRRPSGLYFGTAGAAWALLDAGLALGDDGLVEDAVAVAEALPVSAPGPDVTHGTAGIGLTALHLWARTGRPLFAERALAAADALAASVEEGPDGLVWRTPAHVESKLAGKSYYGFAHGIAGVGYFLLACAEATGRVEHRELAVRVGDSLLDAAVVTPRSAMWGAGTGDPPTAPYWCHGASGIGTFLVRLGAATGEARFLQAADLSARAVTDQSWRAVLGQCHGLAGNGDFLLDMADVIGDARHRAAAWRLARIIVANRAHRDGRIVLPDERGDVSTSWGEGLSGVLAFLVRLRYGAERLWMADGAPGAAEDAVAGTAVRGSAP
ncbi:class IV lanthionine synthetase LanL [Actinomadura opuntiae]|uniref:class IV lanthionine synthetase LanL n=1 Tax=Actinomadura sp. OS1-43 TaxID=604315 RepID=UPI00255A93B9|nr:class IV lanthionine synthetase LanL [Actinomadura sp. OS1-43]MDL4814176.1 class IV lanthionine synthetase LanL [Actinomadura sp. OS1-43]